MKKTQIQESELQHCFYRHDRIGSFDHSKNIFVETPKNINMPSRHKDLPRVRGPIAMITHCIVQTGDGKFYHGIAARSAGDQLNRVKARSLAFQRATSLLWDITDNVPREFDKSNSKILHAICDQKYQEIVNFDKTSK